jgi:hypothetical protein
MLTVNTASNPPWKVADVANGSGRDFGLRLGHLLAAHGPLHVSGGKEQARPDLIRRNLDLGTMLALLGLPAALIQPTDDDDAHPLGEGYGEGLRGCPQRPPPGGQRV